MRKTFTLTVLLTTMYASSFSQQKQTMKPEETEVWDPVPPVVNSAPVALAAPSDAVVLFDGTNLDKWEAVKGGAAKWQVKDGAMTVVKGAGDIKTKDVFGSYQLHVEWRSPDAVVGTSQGRGNSGIFMQGLYEVQVLDNYNNRTYSNGQAGSIYKQHIPLVNACRKPGEWQSYDIIWTAPIFNEDGTVKFPARATVLHNGVLVQNNVELLGPTEYIGRPVYKKHGDGPIVLQDHGNPVSFRNIWIRKL